MLDLLGCLVCRCDSLWLIVVWLGWIGSICDGVLSVLGVRWLVSSRLLSISMIRIVMKMFS